MRALTCAATRRACRSEAVDGEPSRQARWMARAVLALRSSARRSARRPRAAAVRRLAAADQLSRAAGASPAGVSVRVGRHRDRPHERHVRVLGRVGSVPRLAGAASTHVALSARTAWPRSTTPSTRRAGLRATPRRHQRVVARRRRDSRSRRAVTLRLEPGQPRRRRATPSLQRTLEPRRSGPGTVERPARSDARRAGGSGPVRPWRRLGRRSDPSARCVSARRSRR